MNKKDFLEITVITSGDDFTLFKSIIDGGIDSHLQAFTKSKFEVKPSKFSNRLYMNFHKSELSILKRRLQERLDKVEPTEGDSSDYERIENWLSDIQSLED